VRSSALGCLGVQASDPTGTRARCASWLKNPMPATDSVNGSIQLQLKRGRIMKTLAAVIAVAAFACGAASASDKTDAMAVVHKWVDAFNKGDGKTGASYCADGALVIDDFAPHVWQGSGACASWYKD
jgi:hypothetical protein